MALPGAQGAGAARARGAGGLAGPGREGAGAGGSQGGSVPALRGPGGPLTPLRPGALSSQPDSAAATAGPGAGLWTLPPPAAAPPPPRPRHARHAPSPRPSAAPGGGGGPPPSLSSPGPPTRGCGPWPPLRAGRPPTARGGETGTGPAGSEAAVGPALSLGPCAGPRGRSGLQDPGLSTGSEWVARAPRQGVWRRLSRAAWASPGPRWALRTGLGWSRAISDARGSRPAPPPSLSCFPRHPCLSQVGLCTMRSWRLRDHYDEPRCLHP